MNKLILFLLWIFSICCYAQPTSVIVPYPPGNGGDTIFRIFETYCQSKNIQVVPVYKTGFDGVVGLTTLGNSDSEKYIGIAGTVSIIDTLKQNPNMNFTYISLASIPTWSLVASKKSSISSLTELENKIKTTSLNIGSGGASHVNLIKQLLDHTKNKSSIIVPYKNNNQLILDLFGGRIDIAFLRSVVALKYEEEGKLTILASTDKINKNITLLPNRYKNWINVNAYGLVMPENANTEDIKFWSEVMKNFLNDESTIKLIENDGSKVPTFGPKYFKKLVEY